MARTFARTRPANEEVLALQTQVGTVLDSVLADKALQDDGPWIYVRRSTEQGDGPIFLNGTTNYDGGASWEVVRFRKDRFNRVWVEGTAVTGAYHAVFQLPKGYRPRKYQSFVGAADGASNSARIDVHSDGNVILAAGGGGVFFSLGGINFEAEA